MMPPREGEKADNEGTVVEVAILAMERERERFSTLVRRSEVLDSRAGTLLSALVIVGGVIGAFWTFLLDKDSASAVDKLASDDLVVASLIGAIVLYGCAAVLMGASLLISIHIWDSSKDAPRGSKLEFIEEALSGYYEAAENMIGTNDWKWKLLAGSLAASSLALAAIGFFASRVFLLVAPS